MPGRPMSRTETKGERKRTITEKQNTSNSSYCAEEVTPQIISLATKPFVIFTDALFKVDAMFVCFLLKCERKSAFLIRLPNWFSICLDSGKKVLPLCEKHVFAMSSRKIRVKSH